MSKNEILGLPELKSIRKYNLTCILNACKVKSFKGLGLSAVLACVINLKELFRMANHASALKAHRQNLKHRSTNRSNRSSLRTCLKQFNDRLEAGKSEEAKNSLSELVCRNRQIAAEEGDQQECGSPAKIPPYQTIECSAGRIRPELRRNGTGSQNSQGFFRGFWLLNQSAWISPT